MSVLLSYFLILLAYTFIGVSLGAIYRLIRSVNLYAFIKKPALQQLAWMFTGVAILYPVWSFLFGYFGSDYNFTPRTDQVWLVSIGVALACYGYKLVSQNVE